MQCVQEIVKQAAVKQKYLIVGECTKSVVCRVNSVLVVEGDVLNCGQSFDHVLNSLYGFEVGDDLLGGFELRDGIVIYERLLIVAQRFISVSCRLNVCLV